MIEDELRDLLAERAATVPDNPARVADVHARIGASAAGVPPRLRCPW